MAELNHDVLHLLMQETTSYNQRQITKVLELLHEGNTVPFIARYRKEMTSGLDEVQIREIEERYQYLENLEKRKQEVARLIDEQGKLTSELAHRFSKQQKCSRSKIFIVLTNKKRRTKATIAKKMACSR